MKQKSKTEDFLVMFKMIELKAKELYGTDKSFADLESECMGKGDFANGKKMQLCRNLRNYASHNPDMDEFIPVPEETLNYLMKIYKYLENQTKKAKDEMSRIKPLSLKDNLIQGAKRLGRLPEMPVVDEDGKIVGIFTNDVLRKCVSDEISMKSKFIKEEIKLKPLVSANCVSQQAEMQNVDNKLKTTKVIYVTDDGTANGKFIGVITNGEKDI